VQRLGGLSGKPATSKLHIHPVANSDCVNGSKDDEISVISSEQAEAVYRGIFRADGKRQSLKEGWHSDITFEPIPSDYALLRLTQLPRVGSGRSNIFHLY
jgi:alpha-ketoglutarate-dependent taurine dioxygenase